MDLRPWKTRSGLGVLLPFGKALYREQALAVFRLTASLLFLLFFPLQHSFTAGHPGAVRLMLFGYALSSLFILARVFAFRRVPYTFLLLVHASDVIWPSLICLFTGCINSPFLLLYILALLAAPYRGKTLETLAITLSSVFIVLSETVLATLPPLASEHLLRTPLQPGSFAVRASLLLTLCGFLTYTAYWTQREQQAYATRFILRRLHADVGIQANVREILPALLSIFEADKVVVVLRNSSTWRVFQWGARSEDSSVPGFRDLPPSQEDQYFWPMPLGGWSAAFSGSRSRCVVALDPVGTRIRPPSPARPAPLRWDQPFRLLLATTLQFGSEWTGRLFLVNPQCAAGTESCLRLLHHVADEVGPAVYNFYLWRHTSVRVRAIERQRLARDLHDGVIQSLIAADMQLEVLRRQTGRGDLAPSSSQPVAEAQRVLRVEVQKLRAQIDQLRSGAYPRQVLPCLSGMLESFQQETGIQAAFACNVREETIPRRVSAELVRIVEEALSNVRKHSGAQKVEVNLIADLDSWQVIIQDNGRGFDFSGRLCLAELEAARKGPRVIRERVHSVHGDLTLESYPNRGARLEIRFAAHA